jgi:hypothetical protein
MTLAHACKVTGIPAKRIQNAFQVLGRALEYPLEDVRCLGLTLLLADYFGMDLRRAWEVAGEALKNPEEVVRYGAPGRPQIEIDVPRYLTDFGLKCALAVKFPPRMAGRPARSRRPKHSPREFGIDIDALQENLKRTPEERLKSLDENWKFVRALRA